MASQRQAYIKLDECIYDYISESEQSIHKYHKLWYLGTRAANELGLDFFFQIRTVKLPVNANLTVTIPADFLNYSKLGPLNERGEIVALTYNKNLTNFAEFYSDRIAQTEDSTLFDTFSVTNGVFYNYWFNGYYTNIYGVPSGSPFVGNFKVDRDNGVILLDHTFSFPYIMLEYLSSPIEGNDYYIPIQFKEAVISYLRWKDNISMPSKTHVSNSNISMRRADFFNDRRVAIARWKPTYIEEMYQASQEQTRMAIKI